MSSSSAAAPFPESFFGWLDFSVEDQDRMREIFAAFDEKDTVDSLGLGVIRDGIADALFPGVSTIQTRARYFYIVPWICQYVESRSRGKQRAAEDLRWYEGHTIDVLRKTCQANDGVIGWVSGRKLQRMPSSVYWNGLGQLGIRVDRGIYLRQYLSLISAGKVGQNISRRDDDGGLSGRAHGIWDSSLPAAPPRFPSAHDQMIDLTLTEEESSDLRERFVTRSPGSLLAHLARNLDASREVEFPWQVATDGASDELHGQLVHARNFSEAMQGARILYNILLARRSRERGIATYEELEAEAGSRFRDWADQVSDRKGALRRWQEDLEKFWEYVSQHASFTPRSRAFVESWLELALQDPHSMAESDQAEQLVSQREQMLKRKLARLTNDRALENFNGAMLDGAQFAYRWPNARTHLNDIQNFAAEKTDARA